MQRSAHGAPDRARPRTPHEDLVQHRHLQLVAQGALDWHSRRRGHMQDGPRSRSLKRVSKLRVWIERMADLAPIGRSAGVAGLRWFDSSRASERPKVVPPQCYISPMAPTEQQANSRCRVCLLDGTPDTLGRRRQVDMRHPEFTQTVYDSIGNHSKCRRNSTFAAAAEAEWMGR
jgi:hypothetical protein